jgi:hypothetical protein
MPGKRPVFKVCPLCGKVWRGRREFLSDQSLVLNGYQWNVKKALRGEHSQGLLIFTHRVKHCGTTLALRPEQFRVARGTS